MFHGENVVREVFEAIFGRGNSDARIPADGKLELEFARSNQMEVFFFTWSVATLTVVGLAWRELAEAERIRKYQSKRIAGLRSQKQLDAARIARYEARIASLKAQLGEQKRNQYETR